MLKTGTPTASIQSLGRDRTATVGEQLIVSCLSIGSTQTPNLTLHANGQEFQNIYGGRVNLERYNQGDALVGYIDTVSNNLFNHANNLLIECKAWFGDHMFKKKNLNLTKRVSGRPRPVVPGPRPHYPSGGGKYYCACSISIIISATLLVLLFYFYPIYSHSSEILLIF